MAPGAGAGGVGTGALGRADGAVWRYGGGGIGVELCGRSAGGSRSGGIEGVDPGANGSVGHGNGDSVRVVVPVDGEVGGSSVVAQPGGSSSRTGGGAGCWNVVGCS